MPLKVMQQSNGQRMVTIPRQLALAMKFEKGDLVQWCINKIGRLELMKVEDE